LRGVHACHPRTFGRERQHRGARTASGMDILVGEGDLVVEHFAASGRQQGEIFGVPPDAARSAPRPGPLALGQDRSH